MVVLDTKNLSRCFSLKIDIGFLKFKCFVDVKTFVLIFLNKTKY